MTTSNRTPSPSVEYVDPRSTPLASRVIGEERLVLFKQQIARGWKRLPTDAELEMMALYYESGHYDPWARPPQLIFTLRWSQDGGDVLTPQKTIDGLRLDAARSRDYLGQVGPQWCGIDGVWVDIWLRKEPPAAARVGILRRGAQAPTWSVALYSEWCQQDKQGNPTSFWRDKPAHMLAKTAEAAGLRRVLPNETDPVAQQHMRELERLAMPQAAALHERIFGNNDRSPYDLGGYIPSRERELSDRPRPALGAGGELVDADSGEVLVEAPQPALGAAKRERTIGELHEAYGALLTSARHSGAVPEGQVSNWLLPAGADRAVVESKGKALRAVYDAHQAAQRNRETIDRAESIEYDQSPDEDEAIAEAQADDEAMDAELAGVGQVTSVNDVDYQQLASAIQEAARLEVAYDDCRVQLPCSRDEVVRKLKVLGYRTDAVKENLAAGRGRPKPEAEVSQPALG